ncbi:SRPBCC domain-containing protein [Tessaracoccus sp. HDW20]|uniref:SRPBCC family protein n=1 Tax=Tessaracoccus coleopterorum TaxID=2714950 RepID=UPI0018D30DD1|nr:SRPBCC domain-containing protein [Tessaracoccus coleopterorum]NHB84798.1 SRPBCC domain-containing protein [Tessaracoccus coleopterorum]
MPLTDATHDLESRTIILTADFAAPVERVWQVYADPRQLERVWGPPTHPATFVDHDLAPGGRMNYFMTGPDGERYYGFWRVTEVDSPRSFTFEDGFAVDETFAENTDLPVSINTYRFEPNGGHTTMTAVSVYPTAESLQQVLDMGMIEGATSAINQIDGLLTA